MAAYQRRLSFLIGLDSVIVLFSIYIGYFILHPYLNIYSAQMLIISSIALLSSHHLFAAIYRLYHKAWEYASVGELIAIAKAVTFSVSSTAIVQLIVNHDVYIRVLLITWMLHMLLIGGSRFSWRVYRDRYIKKDHNGRKRTMIVGAGAGGSTVVRQLLMNDSELEPVLFVDDDLNKLRLEIYGVTVLGTTRNIPYLVDQHKIDNIIIAIPSLKRYQINHIYEQCTKTKAKVQIIPLLEDVFSGKVSVSQLRDVAVEDLLGRDPIELDIESIAETVTGKTVLVTGAGGSIGSEICRQISVFQPKKLVLVGHGENSIYQIDMEMRKRYKDLIDIVPVIADVQDRERMFDVLAEHSPDVVYHAAAHKHVPLMEYNPKEAVKNNIFGTKNTAEASASAGVKRFVLVSTDKAVNPTNVMGATKRVAEMVVQQLDREYPYTTFTAVRFGNVLGSRGSVIPLFKKQLAEGGPLTVTHKDMTRYFMTIPEASRLVIQSSALARGGEIFVLDMGEPVKIVDLARNLIKLSGYSEEEVGIQFSGLRPGEKMYEELLNENEIHLEQVFPKIHIGKAGVVEGEILWKFVGCLSQKENKELRDNLIQIANTKENLKEVMQEVVI
ncbi:nucleoside-diphosphate sugar epimerase/dehydratase [Domibacillus sp. DTU_2020_1001157_1_SI_ALB_TIR_016]|uniref:polysaccharide biosynthesis protein n=1 Tax=Domibacillus sp. DTU_2020_1001157_1_SI_ALB_TIR_016 TaxID=3077789 RepID=UPI0028E2E3DF|nr:nucleoside-diphosphate sugar epimerase/dehydratase [Domibacillus sp. DTU_2020_1001157_1_SI_ALB_TIR_016]WNS81177.1 nucleoside-diphosphate sugar epimerase/dehydratase [Domibacillus sp. DTU_2020_1001157_1_SI_ALB_TIR_016]